MSRLEFAVWTLGGVAFLYVTLWMGMLLIRWAKKGSKGTALLGLGMSLPAAYANPQPPKEIQIEEVADQIHGKKNSDSAGPDR